MSISRKMKPKALEDIPTSLKEACAGSLLNILKSIDGEKDLVMDSQFISSLEYIVNSQQLKSCGIKKFFKLESGSPPGLTSQCVYLVKSSVENTKIIADHVKVNYNSDQQKSFWVVFVPRCLYVCDMVLESEGVYGLVKVLEYPLGLIPVDSDLLSLEQPEFFTSYFLAKDQTDLYNVALSIVQLQKLCGLIQNIQGHGKCANMVIDLMKTLMDAEDTSKEIYSSIDLFIFDRDIDYVSVLLSQLNYEGVLDETFDIKSGIVSFGKAVTGKDEVLKMTLNDEEPVFSEIRNCHFSSVFEVLKNKAKELQVKDGSTSLTIEDMKKIIDHKKNTAKQEKLLFVHLDACAYIIKQKNDDNFQEQLTIESNMIEGSGLKEAVSFIEEVINRQAPLTRSLRLMCLYSITQDGLIAKDYNSLSTQFLQSYGHKHMITLHNLKRLGLFVEQPSVYKPLHAVSPSGTVTASKLAGRVAAAVASFPRQSSFRAISKKMFLIPDPSIQVNLKNPSDTSYVFAGSYTPLIAKLIEEAVDNETFSKYEEALKLLPGLTVQHKPPIPGTVVTGMSKRTVLIYFVGGVSYAEIAALRLIGKLKDIQIIVATTSIINGNSMMHLLMPKTE